MFDNPESSDEPTQLALVRQLKFCAGHRLYRHE